jgi:uncharacterized protein
MKVVVTGATGFIGTALVEKLRGRGDEVIALVRDIERAKRRLRPQRPGAEAASEPDAPGSLHLVLADIETPGPWCERLEGTDAIVHLAGENVGQKRWDARQKQQIRDSRVESTRTIVEALANLTAKPKVLVTAGGVDYYPFASKEHDFDDDEVTESDPASDTFLGRVARDQEHEARAAEALGVRVVCMRTGMVLGKGNPTMKKLRRPFDFLIGGPIGSGRQWTSWIHLDDVVAAYVCAVTDERYSGPINLVAASTRNAELARTLGEVIGKPAWLPAPAFGVKLVVGAEFAQSVLEGRRVVPAKLRELGFAWQHPELREAMRAAV